ncbi:penicillin-binding transpeptidase domain-containing protein [Catenulispora pinisilvae]|uniref:penicillin-binding transpeptidase domain-containing protein n=1 Tax=Catenulispora pinisilvae TaxID=2705253 RepID=UPI001890FAF6|nr:penicillin-binding transpeptidase domain-containing protein [Catenulispora pinisilvae]
MNADKPMRADKPENGPGDEVLENEFRAMFAERSETVRMATAPYASVRQRIAAARRKRRLRLGSAGVAFAVAAAGIGVWATVPGRHQAAVAPISKIPASGGPAKYLYADGHTEIPAGPLQQAALAWLRANYHGDLRGLTVVTTFDPGIQAAANASPGDSGVAVLDARTGAVLGLGGTWDTPMQVADLMKPIVLAAAFQTGHYTPDSKEPLDAQKHPVYWPPGSEKTPLTFVSGNQQFNWPPESPTTTIHDTDVTLTQAADSGANEPFAQLELAADMGPSGVYQLAMRMGMPKSSPDFFPVPSLVLGVPAASPLTMASVYATFNDGGVRHDPRMVGQLLAENGRNVWMPPDTFTRVLSQSTADQVTAVLHAQLLNGPTTIGVDSILAGDRSGLWAAAGAPTSEEAAWLTGGDSHYVASVGVSSKTSNGTLKPLGDDHHGGVDIGSEYAGPIWARVMGALKTRD